MNASKKLERIKLYLTDSEILESFVKYLKSNELNKLCNEIANEYGISDIFESSKPKLNVVDIKKWYESLANKDRFHVDDIILADVNLDKFFDKSSKWMIDHLAEEVNVEDIIYNLNQEYKIVVEDNDDLYNFIFITILRYVRE